MQHLSKIIRFLNHCFPHRHLLAIAGLALFLGILSVVPDSSQDAQANNKTVIVINNDRTKRTSSTPINAIDLDLQNTLDSLDENSDAMANGQAHINSEQNLRNDLQSILELTDFRLDSQSTITDLVPDEVEPRPKVNQKTIEVKNGDNLSLIFYRANLSDQDVYKVSRSGEFANILTNLYPGYELIFSLDESNALTNLEVLTSPLESYFYSLNDEGKYVSSHEVRQPDIREQYKEAVITDSLFLAAQSGGISAAHTMELAGIFGGVIDFILDTRSGDTFNILYEEKYLNGEYIGNGSILAAQFTNQGETFTAIRYTDNEGLTDYFNPEGESMRKAFLRNPVDFVRISSNFNPRRRHPISNTIRAHRGTDYAAPRGTPVVATADGRVTWAARNGSFGKLVVIKHNDRFETKYAHLNDYANGTKVGSRIRQGQVIGYVGSTGGATGPHLHYEFLMDGVHRNSRTIHDQLPKAESIASDELPRFKLETQPLIAQIKQFAEQSQLAMNLQNSPMQTNQ